MRTISEAFDFIENEIWKDIPNYEGLYQVSTFGRVKSLEREVKYKDGIVRLKKCLILNLNERPKNYYSVTLCKYKKISYNVHSLVCEAFLGHIPMRNKICINHINGIGKDNRIENLEIVTYRYNCVDSGIRHKKRDLPTGVNYDKRRRLYYSNICISCKSIHIGCHKTKEEAHERYLIAVENIHKFNGNASEFRDYLKTIR